MNLKNSLRNVFRKEEGLFDLSTTDMDKTIEFAKGDFKRFNTGGSPNPLYSAGTGGGSPIGGVSNYKDLSAKQKKQRTTNKRKKNTQQIWKKHIEKTVEKKRGGENKNKNEKNEKTDKPRTTECA